MTLPGRAWVTAAMMLSLLGAITGCVGGGSAIQRTYYGLDYPKPDQVRRYETPRYDLVVRLPRFSSTLAYDRSEFAYRSNPYELRYDFYRVWVAKPKKMLREHMANHLQLSNLFRSVVADLGERLPDYDLRCDVVAIEELDSTEKTWFAHLAMRCGLNRFEDGRQVLEFSFDEKRPVYERNPIFVVQAMSDIYDEQLTRLAAELDGYFAGSSEVGAWPATPVDSNRTEEAPSPPPNSTAAPAPPTPSGPQPSARLKPPRAGK